MAGGIGVKVYDLGDSHSWRGGREIGTSHHMWCYFCKPSRFTPMPPAHTLCVRCGQLIYISSGPVSPMNNAMVVCNRCEEEMQNES